MTLECCYNPVCINLENIYWIVSDLVYETFGSCIPDGVLSNIYFENIIYQIQYALFSKYIPDDTLSGIQLPKVVEGFEPRCRRCILKLFPHMI